MSVCLSVCLSVCYLLFNRDLNIDLLYMDPTEIYLGVTRTWLELRPTDRSDAIGPNADAIGTTSSKMAVFLEVFDRIKGLLIEISACPFKRR